MEFDLLFNLTPIFFFLLLIFVALTTVFQKLKLRWPVKINCWFCNNNTKIWRQQRDWWLCPYCEQYNGFSKNGDYSYDIPEQYMNDSLNESKRYCTVDQAEKINQFANNGLCSRCNRNESIKLAKLSDYVPASERNYEYEIKKFKDDLELQYPICAKCKNTVHNVLHKQSLWMTQYKMSFFRQKPFISIAHNKGYSEPICRIISTVLGSMVAYNMEFICLPIGGLFFQFCACWITSAKKQNSDILLMFLWICMIVLLPFKDTKLIKTDLQNPWFSLEYITQYHMIILFVSVISFINVMPKPHKNTSSKDISFKKMEPFSNSCTEAPTNKHNSSFKTNVIVDKNIINKPLLTQEISNDYMPYCEDNSVHLESNMLYRSFRNQESRLSTHSNDNSTVFSSTPLIKKNITENHLLYDSMNSLSILSLSEDKPRYTMKAPKMFERKVYSTRSSELFRKSVKKNILSPPKLKTVTQTSWVAGGYWQEGIDAPSLSRSSSQSSGFGSVASNIGPSREPSIHEFDQCSVVSDITQYTMRQSNSPVSSFCQQSQQYQLKEPRNQSVNNQTVISASPTLCSSQLSFSSFQNNKKSNTFFTNSCCQAQNIHANNVNCTSDTKVFPSHNSLVTSPVWIPALLCGSLVLNLVVLCTTLLR